jgi:hypothetical protein
MILPLFSGGKADIIIAMPELRPIALPIPCMNLAVINMVPENEKAQIIVDSVKKALP